MIDTWISLKIILILAIGILALDESFLALQTTETTNFYAGRAAHVEKNVYEMDNYFNQHVLRYLALTKQNPFVYIDGLKTSKSKSSEEWKTHFHLSSLVEDFTENSHIMHIQQP